MPVPVSAFDVKPWTRPAETTDSLDWAPLKIIDLSVFDKPGGKQKLAEDLRDSAKNGAYSAALHLLRQVIDCLTNCQLVSGSLPVTESKMMKRCVNSQLVSSVLLQVLNPLSDAKDEANAFFKLVCTHSGSMT